MHIYARQGDLVIEKLTAPLAEKLHPAKDLVLSGSGSGHRHVLRGRSLAQQNGSRTRVRLAEPAPLEHEKPDGHKTVELEPGDYEIRPLRERGADEDRDVID